jgi:flagellar biogenesis protein FliO
VKRRAGEQCELHFIAAAALMLVCLVMCHTAAAQSTRPAGIYEDQTIRKDGQANSPTSRQSNAVSATPTLSPFDAKRVVFALTLVLVLIFGLRWVVKRYFPNVAGASNGIVRVLSRSPLTPKQHVLLVQVGKRVLVVADNGTQMNSLSEITDADEVAMLVGQTTARASTSVRETSFDAKFDKAAENYEEKPQADVSEVAVEEMHDERALGLKSGEIDGLMDKVRALAKQLGKS